MTVSPYLFPTDGGGKLADFKTTDTTVDTMPNAAKVQLKMNRKKLAELQRVLAAHDRHGVLVIFQALDAAGKDGTIRRVFSGINPAGCQVTAFKVPSKKELDHDYLWRTAKMVPRKGMIGIFNRSYYEEVLVVRVHPQFLDAQKLVKAGQPGFPDASFWQQRFDQINHFEQYLTQNQTTIIKFFLHVSKAEQKRRFMARINEPEKNWKFSLRDVHERGHWSTYMAAYDEMLQKTSTTQAPWYVIPADDKKWMRAAVAEIVVSRLKALNLSYPTVTGELKSDLAMGKQLLGEE